MRKTTSYTLIGIILSACSFAPPYHEPPMSIPEHFKETGPWIKITSPIQLKNSMWWTEFHDPVLNELEQKVTYCNQNIKMAIAQYEKASALAQLVRSKAYPNILGVGNPVRQDGSNNIANKPAHYTATYNTFLLVGDLTYEIDAWGRVRNSIASQDAQTKASFFDLYTINLRSHAELAADYFTLREYNKEQAVLDRMVRAYTKTLYLVEQRHKGGMVPIADVYMAQTDLENAKTAATSMRLKRAQLEHAIAILTGVVPAEFTMPTAHAPIKWIMIPPDLPSTLLTKRPDIASSIEKVKAANADIGVARAAFFPQFNLTALYGVQSAALNNLFTSPSIFWSFGAPTVLALVQPGITQVIFDGYALQAKLKYAKAHYYETITAYRDNVLQAFREVEDNLVALRRLSEELATQKRTVDASTKAWDQANKRYAGGLTTYLDVVVYENKTLRAQFKLIQLETQRQIASIRLIESLGGGFSKCRFEHA